MGADSIVFLGFNLHAWITIATVLTMFSVLLFTKLRSDLVFLGAIAILFVTGVLDAKEAFSGFSSTSVVVVGVLFVVVAGLMHTGVLMNLIILAANIFIVNIVYPLTPLP
jgi:di/tricarboxylate transporter